MADRASAPDPDGVAAAAAQVLEPLLTGPVRTGCVLAAFPSAVYVETSDDVVAVVTRDALRLPGSLVLAAATGAMPFAGIRAGDAASLGCRRVVAGPTTFDVRRWWRPARPRRLLASDALAQRCEAIESMLPALPSPLPGNPSLAKAGALVGLGPGLTPAGDDVVAGALLTLSAAAVDAPTAHLLTRLRSVADSSAASTTALSATLLRHAALGLGVPPLIELVDVLADVATTRPELASAVARLLAVGHTSGTALAHGVLLAARQVALPAAAPRSVPTSAGPGRQVA